MSSSAGSKSYLYLRTPGHQTQVCQRAGGRCQNPKICSAPGHRRGAASDSDRTIGSSSSGIIGTSSGINRLYSGEGRGALWRLWLGVDRVQLSSRANPQTVIQPGHLSTSWVPKVLQRERVGKKMEYMDAVPGNSGKLGVGPGTNSAGGAWEWIEMHGA